MVDFVLICRPNITWDKLILSFQLKSGNLRFPHLFGIIGYQENEDDAIFPGNDVTWPCYLADLISIIVLGIPTNL